METRETIYARMDVNTKKIMELIIKLKNGGLTKISKEDKILEKELLREGNHLYKELVALGKFDEKVTPKKK